MNFLKGYRTYIVVIVGVLANGCYAMGLIPEMYIPLINIILGYLGLAALRAGIK